MEEPGQKHEPVLLEPLLDALRFGPEAILVDATIGQGGHAYALSNRLNDKGLLIGLDVDASSLETARNRLTGVKCRVELRRANFGYLDDVLQELGVKRVSVILADLGFCSAQMADRDRGFSFQEDGPLDMRLDDRIETTAADLVNGLPEKELADLLYEYGEERKSRRIAKAIVTARRRQRLTRTLELSAVILEAFGLRDRGWQYKIHPATRTFQALRIAVNEELKHLERLLELGPNLLVPGGQMAVISFHSLEDRLIKNSFRVNYAEGIYDEISKKPIVAGREEILRNRRSRSAKLRVARCGA